MPKMVLTLAESERPIAMVIVKTGTTGALPACGTRQPLTVVRSEPCVRTCSASASSSKDPAVRHLLCRITNFPTVI